ncbi:MAG TPA: DNA translocase FtsK 4TM domain-containing protein [Methylococcaceae bacterium]|nr:DNA translocase FtsK 4TM domain-containing protein [Methylococcaceae bacterium]
MASLDKDAASTLDDDNFLARGLRELAFLGYLALALYLLLSLATYSDADGGWSHSGGDDAIQNGGGAIGAWLADVCLYLIGLSAYLLPVLAAWQGWRVWRNRPSTSPFAGTGLRLAGALVALLASTAFVQMLAPRTPLPLPGGSGGIFGELAAEALLETIGTSGTRILLAAALVGGLTLFTGISWLKMVDWVGEMALSCFRLLAGKARPLSSHPVSAPPPSVAPAPNLPVRRAERVAPRFEAAPTVPALTTGLEEEDDDTANALSYRLPAASSGELPALELLNDSKPRIQSYSGDDLQNMAKLLETILKDFGVDAKVQEIHPGPVITRFEIQPAAGIKGSRISGLAKDLARALLVPSVRIVEIIPGKSFVGIEIPNQERELVLLREVLASGAYADAESPLTLVLGKDISGRPIAANLAKMPHLLVAGTTGSGKSVAVNVMILSLLYKATPEEIRLIMIDPKMLELSVYEGIPHLLTPVVTDMKEAANALRWCVAEMERRYKLMSMLGVRNIGGYNEKVLNAEAGGKPLRNPMVKPDELFDENGEVPTLGPLPYIVIVIDELADMMMIVGKKVEELIARLAQKARAAGVHLILATQRPSVDVITGLIKANIPTRVAFQVSSKIDSRTIIDQGGAEALLGNGDMLFLPPGTGLPVRVHGSFVSDAEVHRVVEFLKLTGPANYLKEITQFSEDGGGTNGFSGGGGSEDEDGESDPLYDDAVRFVTESRKASISSVQRRLKVGYNRAARMIEIMERAGVVGPAEHNGNRVVLAPPPPEL